MYAKHFDSCEMYANLSKCWQLEREPGTDILLAGKFLCNNYRQALNILKTEGALQAWMQQGKIDSVDRFHEWRRGENVFPGPEEHRED
jgi:hypothetical protein